MMTEQQAKEVFADKQFTQSLLEMDTPQQVQAAIKAKGYDISIEEIEQAAQELNKISTDGSLSDDQLEDVAGGIGAVAVLGIVCKGILYAMGTAYIGGAITQKVTRGRW